MESFIALLILLFGVLQIVLFFKLWRMCNDIHELKNQFVKSSGKSGEITNLDEWLKGGETNAKNDDEEKFTVGAEVSAMVDKNGVHMGDVMRVVKIGKGFVICAVDGKSVGKFSTNEVFLVK
jgi:hypothetical protein